MGVRRMALSVEIDACRTHRGSDSGGAISGIGYRLVDRKHHWVVETGLVLLARTERTHTNDRKDSIEWWAWLLRWVQPTVWTVPRCWLPSSVLWGCLFDDDLTAIMERIATRLAGDWCVGRKRLAIENCWE